MANDYSTQILKTRYEIEELKSRLFGEVFYSPQLQLFDEFQALKARLEALQAEVRKLNEQYRTLLTDRVRPVQAPGYAYAAPPVTGARHKLDLDAYIFENLYEIRRKLEAGEPSVAVSGSLFDDICKYKDAVIEFETLYGVNAKLRAIVFSIDAELDTIIKLMNAPKPASDAPEKEQAAQAVESVKADPVQEKPVKKETKAAPKKEAKKEAKAASKK